MKEDDSNSDYCQYFYPEMLQCTLPDARLALPVRRHWWTLKRLVWYAGVLGVQEFVTRGFSSTRFGKWFPKKLRKRARLKGEVLNLKVGEIVEVRSAKEILATLDKRGKLKGLGFTPEMMKFCGRRLRVYRKLDRIILEATGELRKIRTPTVLLEGVFCDGKSHGGCDRSCFCFWREEWLKKVS